MTDKEKLGLFEEMLELESGTLSSDMRLESIEQWDSVASLSFIVLLEEKFQKTVSGVELRGMQTVADALSKMG